MSNYGKVIPNLSIRSKELHRRLENRSFIIREDGKTYSTDQGVLDTLRMDRAELFREHLRDNDKIRSLKEQANKEDQELGKAKAKAKDDALFAKAKAEAIAELAKAKGNG